MVKRISNLYYDVCKHLIPCPIANIAARLEQLSCCLLDDTRGILLRSSILQGHQFAVGFPATTQVRQNVMALVCSTSIRQPRPPLIPCPVVAFEIHRAPVDNGFGWSVLGEVVC